jgi:antitoxin (DNA-binding transcriptional repressor) of toxin-antitoxin stability system
MSETVSTLDIRQRLGDILNRVALRNDEFIVKRKGKALAAIVPVARLDQMRRFARRHALAFLEQQSGGTLSEKEAGDMASAARTWARQNKRRRKPRSAKAK